MKSLFKGYYQPTPEQFEELWKEGTFVFDTNVLLNLYRYKVESRDEVLNVIRQIENRVWIPYQVGLEFHRNRLTVLGEQNSSLSTIKKSIRDSIISIEKKCEDLDLDKRHSEIKTSTFIERFRELSESVINELDEIKAKKLTNDIDDDVVLTEISALFSTDKASLGSHPKDQKVLEGIYKDGEFRAKNKIPPSFEDILEAQKNKSGEEYYAFEGLNYKHGYGDLIVWKQIIEFAKENQKNNIIFVTDDKKEDWMRIINSHGKKTISARPELVSEIFREAGVKNFYIYDTKNFLKYSKEYLKTNVQDETINDVKKIYYVNNNFQIDVKPFERDEEIIKSWLSNRYLSVERSGRLFNYRYLVFDDFGPKKPVYIRYLEKGSSSEIISILNHIVLLLMGESSYQDFHIILVVSDMQRFFLHNNQAYRKMRTELRDYITAMLGEDGKENLSLLNILITLGYLSRDSESFTTLIEFDIND